MIFTPTADLTVNETPWYYLESSGPDLRQHTWNDSGSNVASSVYVGGSPVVTESSLEALIDKRLDERLKRGTFAERLQMKYPIRRDHV